jgi:hypothetical protein
LQTDLGGVWIHVQFSSFLTNNHCFTRRTLITSLCPSPRYR